MTDTTQNDPERIWATGDNRNGSWTCKLLPEKWAAKPKEYILKSHHDDLVQAAVAAALREAAERARMTVECCQSCASVELQILALITPDAQAALDRLIKERSSEAADWRSQSDEVVAAERKKIKGLAIIDEAGTVTPEMWDITAAIRKGSNERSEGGK